MGEPIEPLGELFEPHPEDSSGRSIEYENTNICRAVTPATLVTGHPGLQGYRHPLETLGYLPGSWRPASEDAFSWIRLFFNRIESISMQDLEESAREQAWSRLSQTGAPESAAEFLSALLYRGSERESTVAAATMLLLSSLVGESGSPSGIPLNILAWLRLPYLTYGWPDDYGSDLEYFLRNARARKNEPGLLALPSAAHRIAEASHSEDPFIRSIGAPFLEGAGEAHAAGEGPELHSATECTAGESPGQTVVSTMIHGTFGFRSRWWRPRDAFFRYLDGLSNGSFFKKSCRYHWGGGYLESSRRIATTDLVEWHQDHSPGGLERVLAHSYGGEVIARAIKGGVLANNVVLLSTPITQPVLDLSTSHNWVSDVRLQFDIVLELDMLRRRLMFDPIALQPLPPRMIPPSSNVNSIIIDQWGLDHSATHKVSVWEKKDIFSNL